MAIQTNKSITKILSLLVAHLTFWTISFFVLYGIFTVDYDSGKSDVIYTLLFHLPILSVVYLNHFMIEWIVQRRYGVYFLGFLLLALLGVGLHFLIFEVLTDYLVPGYYFISYYGIWQILQFTLSYLIISTLIFLTVHWFQLQDRQLSLEKENFRVKLDNLKAQLNPHFLINSLNNIYSLTKQEKKEANSYLVKLSDALRYMVYETDADEVLLEQDLDYLDDYIALEQLRMEDLANFKYRRTGDFEGYYIAPLILLPFVENCFKHCERSDPHIDISVTMKGHTLVLDTTNNYSGSESNTMGGVGLRNARRRLALIYPGKHRLNVQQTNQWYKLSLEIDFF